MPRRKSNLDRCTRQTEGSRRQLSIMTEEERVSVRKRDQHHLSTIQIRNVEPAERRAARLEDARLRARQSRFSVKNLFRSECIERERMSHVCSYYQALKFNNEMKAMCWVGGKIKLSQLDSPPETLKTLLAGSTTELKHFLSKIRKYNSCF
ncbi:hypothetical protein EVAR_53657_1 [Eumeta japonica]|uniref:Uncharacterized protein n=1 Tax=Eumeta variegata TaxID=151549 RepID=A0A4C1YJ18_EUMVA|nr:hypothetical protein EVAR_53657_1 [Eumeta japonica]